MALTDSFLDTCRTAIRSLSELTAFRAAKVPAAQTRAARIAAWTAAYAVPAGSTTSLAYRLRLAIRDTINAQTDIGTLGPLDRESAYRTLSAEFAPDADQPGSLADEEAAVAAIFGF